MHDAPDNRDPNHPDPDPDPDPGPDRDPAGDAIEPVDNRVALLILQHPQEQDKMLGTAALTVRHFRNATLKIGLSWPSLAGALGRPADPRRWITLYLGPMQASPQDGPLRLLDGKGRPLADEAAALAAAEGVVLLDGTWSQAKTLWWRNPWLLKGSRAVLQPAQPSLYGPLRREPRREGLSTLEAAALLMSRLEQRPEIETRLHSSFALLLARYRAAHPQSRSRRAPGIRAHGQVVSRKRSPRH